MPPQQLPVVGVNNQLNQPVRFAHGHRFTAGLDIKPANFHIIALLPRLRLREPERGHLRMAVGSPGHQRIIQRLRLLPGN